MLIYKNLSFYVIQRMAFFTLHSTPPHSLLFINWFLDHVALEIMKLSLIFGTKINYINHSPFKHLKRCRDLTPGDYRVSSMPGQANEIIRDVQTIAIHAGYSRNRTSIINDIALIQLAEPFTFSDQIQASEYARTDSPDLVANSSSCLIAGWGISVGGFNIFRRPSGGICF